MFALTNVMRDYAWGSPTAIAELLGREPSGGPEAELWFGAHPDSPSLARTASGEVPLDALIASDPERALGQGVRAEFGDRLPFLVKLLAADQALSLQVHPTAEQARERYEAEEAAGIPHDAPHRNYRDPFHKPELILALTPFEALCGFRPCAESARLFRDVIAAISASGSPVPPVLHQVEMALNSRMVAPAVVRRAFELLTDAASGSGEAATLAAAALAPVPHLSPALQTLRELAEQYPGDPGVLVSLLLNRVSLQPGEAIHLPAGNIHAYLKGLGLEVMASSDNVLRGGLTGKHVDVPELLSIVNFMPGQAPVVPTRVTDLGQDLWEPPFAEFSLQRIELSPDSEPVPLLQNGPIITVCVAGSVLLDSPRGDIVVDRGGSVFVPAVENPVMVHPHAGSGNSVLFAVTVASPGPTVR